MRSTDPPTQRPFPRRRKSPVQVDPVRAQTGSAHATTLEPYLDTPFPTSDYVLLCSFGQNPTNEQTTQQLRAALLAAGFSPRVTRHLIRVSPLIHRCSKGHYRLRPYEC
jgi:hypothetical protein